MSEPVADDEPRTSRPVVILGTGAMACWLGGLLARDAPDGIVLAGSWRDALDRLARDGLTWSAPGTRFLARVRAVPLAGDDALPAADTVVVLVKATRTTASAPYAVRAAAPGAPIVTLQNGLGAPEAIAEAWERAYPDRPSPVARGVVTVGARLRAPAAVDVTGPGVIVIERVAVVEPGLRALVARLRAAGVEATLVDDVRPHVWRKLVANCAVNALGALHGVANGALLERDELRASFEAAAREAGAVARVLGVELGSDPVALATAVATATAANRSSMLQDLERGAATEIDAIHGAVVREGRARGVLTPTLAALWDAVRARERAGALVTRA